MRLIVCGGRDYDLREAVYAYLDSLAPSLVVHGDCPTGADRFAREWCEAHGIADERHPADWKQYGDAAGPIRNSEMAALGADLCLAFPGGNGTTDMVTKAKAQGIRVLESTDRRP